MGIYHFNKSFDPSQEALLKKGFRVFIHRQRTASD